MSDTPNTFKKGNRDSIALFLYKNEVPYNPNLPTAKLEEIAVAFQESKPLPHQPKPKSGEPVSQEVLAQLSVLSKRIAALEEAGAGLSKDELDKLATKEDLEDFVPKDELEKLAKKEDLEELVPKAALADFATKEELKNAAQASPKKDS